MSHAFGGGGVDDAGSAFRSDSGAVVLVIVIVIELQRDRSEKRR